MARGSLVAVSYPADDEFVEINTGILGDVAVLAFLDGRPEAEFRDVLGRADVLLGWHLSQELPAGILQAGPGLRLIQLLSAGVSMGFPLGMSAAAESGPDPAARVSVVASIGYFANLAGPPAIGVLAQSAGLLNSFWLIVALFIAAFAAAGSFSPRGEGSVADREGP